MFLAHSGLESSVPQDGEVVTENISTLSLTFNTTIEDTSTFKITKENGQEVSLEESFVKDKVMFGTFSSPLIKEREVTLKDRVINIENNQVFFKGHSKLQVDNIIWATGFIQNYPWLKIDDIYNDKGMIKHTRGLTVVRGLYFLGLPWQYKRGSSLLQGVGEDAKYIMNHINS